MRSKLVILFTLVSLGLSGCGALIGAGAVVGADELKEREDGGGDGLI